MSRTHVKYLLVGGGIASMSAAQAIRARDASGDILMVSQEAVRPYHRTALPQLLARRASERDDVFAVSPAWFDEQRITLRTSCRVVRLDVPRVSAALDSGETVSCERMLLATGTVPRPMGIVGAQLPNVFHLRNLNDAERLHHAIDQAKLALQPPVGSDRGPLRRVRSVVIGGGVHGLEIAAGLRAADLEVRLVETGEHVLPQVLGDVTGRAMGRVLGEHGIVVSTNARPERFEGDGRVQRVMLDTGETLACDLVVIAAGSITPRELLRGTAIACERAILVDRYCQTNVPQIYAAGDCAALLDPLFGKHRQVPSAEYAQQTGAIAGANMTAPDTAPPPVAHSGVVPFSCTLPGLVLKGWGEARLVTRRVYRSARQTDQIDLIEVGIANDGRVAQVVTLNHADDHERLKALVESRATVTAIESMIPNADIPVERWATATG